jgi:ABC-type polysaccharide/polyol phosphate export permease
MIHVAVYFAWTETQARYRRSVLGPFWITLGTLVGGLGLAVVWASILEVQFSTFVPYVTLGIVLWQVISSTITESAGNFYRNVASLHERPISPYFFTYQIVLKGMVTLLHSVPFVFVIIIYLNSGTFGTEMWAIPGLFLVLGNLVWMSHVIGFLGARFRDLEPLLINTMPLLFFFTPVLYEPGRLGSYRFFADMNPIFYLIDVVRGPLIGNTPGFAIYASLFFAMIIGNYLSARINHMVSRRFLHWL